MWCSYEKLCKFCPIKIEISKIFSELNPKVLIFNKKFRENQSNPNMNVPVGVQTKDFSLSPDTSNLSHINNSSSHYLHSVNNFNSKFQNIGNIGNIGTENKHVNIVTPGGITNNTGQSGGGFSIKQDRFGLLNNSIEESEVINRFNPNTNNTNNNNINNNMNMNMTPQLNKEKLPPNSQQDDSYQNLNYIGNYINPMAKQRPNKLFVSSSPNPMTDLNRFGTDINQNSATQNIGSNNQFSAGVEGGNITQNIGIRPFNISNNSNESKQLLPNLPLNNITPNDGSLINGNNTFENISELLKTYSAILRSLSLYNCEEAIKYIKQLPIQHQKTGYILSTLGKCYFELAKYKESEKIFKECLKLYPSQLEGLEIFSSCLWHLKDQYQLCNLANHVLEQSHFCPETWIVVGNCYSLQKEHETALKFFNRAIQINSYTAYAYTLSGHEYVDNESFSQAKSCYTQAIACDDRHFNAWWGLGHIFLKEQNYLDAIKYFRKALSINENSAILNFYLASAYQHNRELSKAMIYLNNAEKLDTSNPMIKYQKANILIFNKKYDEALEILLHLNEKMPKEAPIHILIGKIYKIRKDYTKALAHFNSAIDIDPKDSNLAKSLIEKLYSDIDGENMFSF
jgi:tetratricopeptide (TPR) repeat protein